MRMTVSEVARSVVTIAFEGLFDAVGAAEIDAEFSAAAAANNGIVVDLSGVGFLASVGLRSLMNGAKIVTRQGGRLVLLDPIEEVEKVLEVTGLTALLPVYHDRARAIAAVSA